MARDGRGGLRTHYRDYRVILGFYRGYIGMMGNQMETTIMENQMETTGFIVPLK